MENTNFSDAQTSADPAQSVATTTAVIPYKKPKNILAGFALGLAIVAVILSGFSAVSNFLILNSYSSASSSSAPQTQTFSLGEPSASFTSAGSIADVAKQVSPSVVSIITETKSTSYSFFYGETESTGAAAGTGIIVSSDGYILTNKHVIDSATKIYVVQDDGTVYRDVTLVTTDPLNDVAYLKIPNVSDLPSATLGDSKTISIGQQVVAIGNALGQYQNSVTSGIISGTGRTLTATDENYQNAESLSDMIQTDAAINSGNSGGPLVNADGEVIGINTAVSSGNGIGFAIPISAVKGMLTSILSTGSAKRAFAGIQYSNIDATTALEQNLASTYGALVSSVIKGSPAESSGLKKGDIIVALNGVKIGANRSLATLLGEHTVGEEISLIYLRDGAEHTTTLTLAEYTN